MPSPETASPAGDGANLTDVLDRLAIARLIADWAIFRDGGHWDRLRALYAPDGVMMTTWSYGPADEFVRRSQKAAAIAAARGARAHHIVGAPSVDLNGDRAVAETRVTLMLRSTIDSVWVDVTCIARFHDRLVRRAGNWLIALRVPVYEKDRVDPVDPNAVLSLDAARLAQFADGYRHLGYVQSLHGDTLTPGLVTPGSAGERELLAASAQWLADGKQ